MNSNIKKALKFFVTTGLLIYIISKIDFFRFREVILSSQIIYLVLAVFLILIGILVSVYRWKLFLSAKNISIPLRKVLHYYYIGMFLNSFFPSTIGGDVFKAKLVTDNYKVSYSEVLSSTFFDRLSGLIALAVMSLCGSLINISNNYPLLVYIFPIVIFILTIGIFAISTVYSKNNRLKNSILSRFMPKFLKDILEEISRDATEHRRNKILFLKALGISVFLQLISVLSFQAITSAFHIQVNLIYMIFLIPTINFILFIPVSINGIGLREFAFIFFLAYVGIGATEATIISLVSFTINLLISAGGGISFILNKKTSIRE